MMRLPPLPFSGQKWRQGDRKAVAQQRTPLCFSGNIPMTRASPQKYAAGWAILLLFCHQLARAGQLRYLERIPCIGRDSSLREMKVTVPTIVYSRRRHPSKLVANIDAR